MNDAEFLALAREAHRVMVEHGIVPEPTRGDGGDWGAFRRAHGLVRLAEPNGQILRRDCPFEAVVEAEKVLGLNLGLKKAAQAEGGSP